MNSRKPDPAGAPGQHLAKGTLSVTDAVAISVSVLAPGMAMLLNVPGVAAIAGGSTPLAFLLGGIACLALAFVVIGFTRRMASAGYAYTYASRSLGKSAGFMAGWLYSFGLVCFVPMTMAGVSYLATDLLHLDTGWWFPIFLLGMVLLVVLSVVRIKVTTRIQLVVAAATVLVILIVNVVVTAKGGAHGNTLAPFSFSHTNKGGFSGVFYGIILGITSYIGFETAADFGEETANPRRAIPIAIIASVGFAILFYLWSTYSLTIGFGVDKGSAFGSDPFAMKTIAAKFVGGPLPQLVEIGALLSAFFVCVGCSTAGTRTMFAMGREGVLPKWLGRTHPKLQTPVNATLTVAVVSTVLGAFVGFVMGQDSLGGQPITVYYFFATLGTLAIIVVYIGLCVGGAVFFKRTHQSYNILAHLLVPVVGAALFAAALYGSIYPQPPHPLEYTPYITAIWFILGLLVLVGLRAKRPEAVERIGSILGEEGGADAGGLDAPFRPKPETVTTHRVGIIDDHAHPFPLTPQPLNFAEIGLDVAVGPAATQRRQELASGRLLLEAMRVRLSRYLGCAEQDVGSAREHAARNWPVYVRGLFSEVGVSAMLLDGGSQPVDPVGLTDYSSLAAVPMWSLFRVEAVLDPLIEAGVGADEILVRVSDEIDAAAAAGAVGCKTVLAYRTGLAVDPGATVADARASLTIDDVAVPTRRRGKALRDLVLRRTLAQCGELGLPLQVHTGFGDSDLRLVDADPLGLDDILRTPEGEHASVVLIHAAYPWHEKVAYLAAVRASVWVEFSLVNLLSPATSAHRLLELIELAPTGRILVGSDGHGPPETHWFALTVLRDAWSKIRTELGGITRKAWLDQVEDDIFAGNARALYRLPPR